MNNDKEKVEFSENFSLRGNNFGTQAGERMFIPINPVSPITYVPQRYRSRKTPFQISRGYWDQDEIEITIPEGYQVEAKPENLVLETEFGTYKMSVKLEGNKITYTKDILIKDGVYPKEKYSAYRDFRNEIAKAEEKKISLIVKK